MIILSIINNKLNDKITSLIQIPQQWIPHILQTQPFKQFCNPLASPTSPPILPFKLTKLNCES